jgi:hypothetical protein
MLCLSAERSLNDAVDKSTVLQFFERPFCRPWRNVAPHRGLANGQAYPAVIMAVVASSNLDQHRTSGATQRKVSGRVQKPSVKPNVRRIDPLIQPAVFGHDALPRPESRP